jgi:hypothetical protein
VVRVPLLATECRQFHSAVEPVLNGTGRPARFRSAHSRQSSSVRDRTAASANASAVQRKSWPEALGARRQTVLCRRPRTGSLHRVDPPGPPGARSMEHSPSDGHISLRGNKRPNRATCGVFASDRRVPTRTVKALCRPLNRDFGGQSRTQTCWSGRCATKGGHPQTAPLVGFVWGFCGVASATGIQLTPVCGCGPSCAKSSRRHRYHR